MSRQKLIGEMIDAHTSILCTDEGISQLMDMQESLFSIPTYGEGRDNVYTAIDSWIKELRKQQSEAEATFKKAKKNLLEE